MKTKNTIIITLAAILLFAVPAVASTVDFSFIKEYSDEDLQALRQEIDAEILSRDIITYTELQPTEYLIGKDIPAGRYSLSFVENPNDRKFINYYIFNSVDDWDGWSTSPAIIAASVDTVNAPDVVELEDGQLFVFFEGTIKMEKSFILWK